MFAALVAAESFRLKTGKVMNAQVRSEVGFDQVSRVHSEWP